MVVVAITETALRSHLKPIDNSWRKVSLHLTADVHPDVSDWKGAHYVVNTCNVLLNS